ncbi:Ankyrin repeat domain-containing protein 60 [Phytophthora boehmeriae]|uniref:Ankyrin repeat domain-containing protein 60 n=1 Tax=Phytophthora boehmeriae TaxID=109152 RepID=A0A8T1WMH0_9STRA|nr:Ankyrin repeat domain-containing protein 60 [Phytophthora boehmeriae]
MKSPTNYGSENEETTFIRRVAAPDRPNAGRRQKKRLILAGAGVTLVSASAAVGYAAFRSSGMDTATMPAQQQLSANLVAPDFVSTMGDGYYPEFDVLDQNEDGIVTYPEYMSDLNEVWDADKENIANADLPEVVKDDLYDQLNEKISRDTACVKRAMVPTKKRVLTFNRQTIDSLYYMLEVFCFEEPIEIPQKYFDEFPSTPAPTEAPAVEVSTPQGKETVIAEGPPVDGKETVEVVTPNGATKVEEVPVVETSEGPKAEVVTPSGAAVEVEVHTPATEAPVIEQTTSIKIETSQGTEKIIPEGPPSEGVQTVIVEKSNGETTEEDVPVVETSIGQPELKITTSSGATEVVALTHLQESSGATINEANTNEGNHENTNEGFNENTNEGNHEGYSEITNEGNHENTNEGNNNSEQNYMTKVEFRDRIGQEFTGRLQSMMAQVMDEEELTDKLRNWQISLSDCIDEAANRFGYYGVYEQAPYYDNAINWVSTECWKI